MPVQARQLLAPAALLLEQVQRLLQASSLADSPSEPLLGLACAMRSVRRAQFVLKKLLSREPWCCETCGRMLNSSSGVDSPPLK